MLGPDRTLARRLNWVAFRVGLNVGLLVDGSRKGRWAAPCCFHACVCGPSFEVGEGYCLRRPSCFEGQGDLRLGVAGRVGAAAGRQVNLRDVGRKHRL